MRKLFTSLIAMLVGASLLVSAQSTTASATDSYADVPDGLYYSDAVAWSVEANITGITGDNFLPAQPATRGETAVWLWRMAGQPSTSAAHSFTDVPDAQSPAVSWLASQGITSGTSATDYSPDRILNRGELAALLWRASGSPTAEAHSFVDVVLDWQQGAVSWLAATGITTGTSDTTFSPDNTLSRAQLITFLFRYNQRHPSESSIFSTSTTSTTSTSTTTSTTPTTTTTMPPQVTTITVPSSAPSGRCASAVLSGVYNWETCAWRGYRENKNFHYSLSDENAKELIERIWAEVNVVNKRTSPPESELVPAGSRCATISGNGIIIGCYDSSRHHIRRLDAFNDTLLHEVAHALVVDHPSVAACSNAATNAAYQTCAHNDIFRCVADHLYVTYTNIPSAGVCGNTQTTPGGGSGDGGGGGDGGGAGGGGAGDGGGGSGASSGSNPGSPIGPAPETTTLWQPPQRLSNGALITFVDASSHTRKFPYADSWASLVARCSATRSFEVYFVVESGFLLGRFQDNRIPVRYAFFPKGWDKLSAAEQSAWRDRNPATRELWNERSTARAAFQPVRLMEDLINDLADPAHAVMLLAVTNWNGADFGTFQFSTAGSADYLRAVTEECGWSWT
ncbi:MAG: S-layer homology domain-containing protein [Acidimicrobiia bacterium]|nr:S-layer homology domain-containing protein [Acidimicrobiia bacterium]